MSNLLKQQYVISSNTQKRVINTNTLMEERVKEWNKGNGLRFQKFEEEPVIENSDFSDGGTDSFSEGIAAQVVDVEPEIHPEEILEQARQQAQAILDEAKAEAQQMQDEARQQAQDLFEQMKEDGYQAGAQEKEQELLVKEQNIDQMIEKRKTELEDSYQERLNSMEKDIVETLIRVVDHVFQTQLTNQKEILFHLVRTTLQNIEVGKSFRIRIAEVNHRYLEDHLDDIKERIGNDIAIEIVNDANLGPNDCLIETDFGVFDCGIDTEFDTLVQNIRTLCN